MKKIGFILFLMTSITFGQQKTENKEEITVSAELKGTLFHANSDSVNPVLAIIIAGSGPTNRSGNQIGVHNNSLKYLAEGLASNGIHTFSFDKRVIAQIIAGTADTSSMLFDDNSKDVNQIVSFFRNQNKYSKIVLIGHSEGSLIGMQSATSNIDAFVSIAGAGRPIDVILKEQISKNYPYIKKEFEEKIDLLKIGEPFVLTSENAILTTFFNSKNRPYLQSWMAVNPIKAIQKLTIPVLIINGTKDLQVPETEALLLKESKKDASLVIIKNMNHVLKIIEGDEKENKDSYNNPKLPVATELVFSISNFIKKL